MGAGVPAPQNLYFPPRLPRSLCGVQRESGRDFQEASNFVKAVQSHNICLAKWYLIWYSENIHKQNVKTSVYA
jgi:hypothetical protein